MENANFATRSRKRNRRLSTLAVANVIMMAGASKAADAAATADNPSATPVKDATATKAAKAGTAATTSTTASTTLNEVVVTAKPEGSYQSLSSANGKYSEPLLDTAQTITIIPQALIKDQNATTLQQALRNVPGITMTAGEGGTLPGDNFNIRGFNARQDIFVDGFRDTGVYNRDPFNLQQIEVVQGPASTYSGHGSTGGSVNLISKAPNLTPSYEAEVGFGTANYYRDTVDINQPLTALSPTAAIRLNAVYQYNNVADINDIYNSRWGVNPSFEYGIGTDTRIRLNYLFIQEQDLPSFGLPTVNATAANANPGLANQVNHVAPVSDSNFYGFTQRDYMNTTTNMPTLLVEHNFDPDTKLTSTSRYGQTYTDEVTTPPRFDTGLNYYPSGALAGNYTTTTYPANTMTRELRGRRQFDGIWGNQTELDAKFDTWNFHHDFVATLEFSQQQEDYQTANGNNVITSLYSPNANDPYVFPINWGNQTRTLLNDYAFSLFDSIKFTPQWILSGGMRYDHLDASAQNPSTATVPGYTARQSNNLASWRLSLAYKPAENGTIYFGYGTSYNPSIEGAASNSSVPSGLTTSTSNLEPEMDSTYEFGTKWDVLDEKLSLTAAFFRTVKENARITDPSLPANSGVYILDGQVRVQGIEVGAQGNLTKEWKIFAGYAYLQSTFLSGPNQGKQLPYTPEQSGSLWTTYELPYHITVGTGVQYNDMVYGSTANTTSVPGYVTQQAMLGYKATEHVSFQMNVYNIWDKNYIASYGNGGAVPGAGRSMTFTSTIKF